MSEKIGVLLTNIGSPSEPTTKAVRQYLKKFLSDPYVVRLPQWLWQPILRGIILPTRAQKSAALYQSIWRPDGSPLTSYSLKIRDALAKRLQVPVAFGMHYSDPSIDRALDSLLGCGVTKLMVLPLFPQYSSTTTASSFNAVSRAIQKIRSNLSVEMIHSYASHTAYINALTTSIQRFWAKEGRPQHLLFSFHGIPDVIVKAGDPYRYECEKTAALTARALQLNPHEWSIAFQSRLGRAQWLTPYLDETLQRLPSQGIQDLHVIAPGFSVDCLETLEEIAVRGQEQFKNAGGERFAYIPALNDDDCHIRALEWILLGGSVLE